MKKKCNYIATVCFALVTIFYIFMDYGDFNFEYVDLIISYILIAVGMYMKKNILISIASVILGIGRFVDFLSYNTLVIWTEIIGWSSLALLSVMKGKEKMLSYVLGVSLALYFFVLSTEIIEAYPKHWVKIIVSGPFLMYILQIIGIFLYAISLGVGVSSTKNNIVGTDNKEGESTDLSFDRLIKLKELLDSGAITQEEFDSVKKDIIGK